MKILIISAHPDDEVIGMGGTIKKLSNNKNDITLCVVSEGASAQYKNKKMIQVRKKACMNAGKFLGISKFYFLDFPDGKLDSVPQLNINKKIEKVISKTNPEIVYTTPNHDLNRDHQKVFESTLVATRPQSSSVKQVMCYELPGISKEPFQAKVFQDITNTFSSKIKAFKYYDSEIEEFPHPRSLKALENLANQRGVESGLKKAEAFNLIRKIEK